MRTRTVIICLAVALVFAAGGRKVYVEISDVLAQEKEERQARAFQALTPPAPHVNFIAAAKNQIDASKKTLSTLESANVVIDESKK